MLKKPFSFWQNEVFTDETRASPATELLEFFEEMERDFLKKHKKFEFGQTITYVFGCNTIRWTEIAF